MGPSGSKSSYDGLLCFSKHPLRFSNCTCAFVPALPPFRIGFQFSQ